MKWLRFFILVVIISIFIPSGIIFAASPSVDDVKVYQNYENTGDWLVVAVYNISGTNTSTSQCGSNYPWYIQLVDNTTGIPVTNNPLNQCGMRPFGIYISPNMSAGLVYNGNYSVKIYGQWGSSPNASRTINNSDWRGSVYAPSLEFDKWIIQEAKVIQAFDGKTYVETVPVMTGSGYLEVLNPDGGLIFNAGISFLSSYKPNLFQITYDTFPMGYNNSSGSTNYADALYTNWDIALGPDVSTALTNAGWYLGIGGRMMGALLTIIGFLSLAIIEKSVAFMVILGGVMIGVFPMATVILLVFVLAVVLIRSLFWSST
jgi:hypothetical protein